MDTDIVMEFNKLWGKISELEKGDAVREFKVNLNNKEIKELKEDFEKHMEAKVKQSIDTVNGRTDRRNNIKIALIGTAAVIIPSLIAIFLPR